MTYFDICKLRDAGFSRAAISRKLSLSRNTVTRYLNKTPDEFEEFVASLHNRKKKLDPYREIIISWLKEHPDLTGALIYDWLQEKHSVHDVSENTVRNYVNELREAYHIPKVQQQRVYTAIPETPMGFQVQVDFGQAVLLTKNGERKRVYFIAFILSHSRYKYIDCLDRPFRTMDVVRCHENAFDFFGGMPEEIVYDQDALISVSENAGDLLFTAEFDKYRKFRGFQIYLCRKSDPESKGKVEQVVKFVKNNFLKNREFKDIETLNHQAIKWLERTGNHKIHHNTKKRPSEVYTLERKHLRKVSSKFSFENTLKPIITRTVQKDNVIRFESNRYSVPLGTYDKRTKNTVYIEITQDDHLLVRLQENGEVIAKHVISSQKGQLIQESSHLKRPTTKKDKLREEIEKDFKDRELISWFLDELHVKYPRHLLDQLKVLSKVINNHPTFIDDALEKVKLLNLISANDFRDIAYSLHVEAQEKISKVNNKSDKYSHLKAAERSEDYYVNVLTGGKKS